VGIADRIERLKLTRPTQFVLAVVAVWVIAQLIAAALTGRWDYVVTAAWSLNLVLFVLFVGRRGYRIRPAIVGGLLAGPLVWPLWLLIRNSQRAGECNAARARRGSS
jgi:hypothetical protein